MRSALTTVALLAARASANGRHDANGNVIPGLAPEVPRRPPARARHKSARTHAHARTHAAPNHMPGAAGVGRD